MSELSLDGALADGRHVMQVRVYYEDTDFSGAVYHASYLRFMERGRTNYLRLLGVDQRGLFEETEKEAPGFAFVVRSMTLDFLKAARMNDLLVITTAAEEVKGASITLRQTVTRGDDLLVEAHVRVAFVSGGRARPIPKPLRLAMKADQQRELIAIASAVIPGSPRAAAPRNDEQSSPSTPAANSCKSH